MDSGASGPTDAGWRERLEVSVQLVRGWEPLLRQAHQPVPGSPLAADDRTYPALPTSVDDG